jgi:hypothetical protein
MDGAVCSRLYTLDRIDTRCASHRVGRSECADTRIVSPQAMKERNYAASGRMSRLEGIDLLIDLFLGILH